MTISERALGLPDRRADAVRARRARKTRQVERAGRIEAPRAKRKRTPRRRYSVTLPVERGAEMQFAMIPAGSVGTRAVALVVIIFALGTLLRFSRAEQFKVGQIEVQGIEMLTAAQVRSITGVEGRSIFFLDPSAIIGLIEQTAEVKSAQIKMGWPNKIQVEVQERLPVVEWDDAGRVWWLSSDGVAYVKHGEHAGLIKIISDESSLQVAEEAHTPVVDPALLRAVASLSKHLPEVGSWEFDPGHGLGFTNELGWQVYFGTSGDMPMKVRMYQAIAEKLVEEGIQPTLLSVEDQSAPYYALR